MNMPQHSFPNYLQKSLLHSFIWICFLYLTFTQLKHIQSNWKESVKILQKDSEDYFKKSLAEIFT